MIQPIVSYCYVIHTSLHAFVQSRRVESLQTKAIYRTLAFFAIPALVGGTFQIVYSVPGLCVGIMISMLLLYIICQEQLISTDPLLDSTTATVLRPICCRSFQMWIRPKMYICL